jgi:uncharacterized protein with NRDE domain
MRKMDSMNKEIKFRGVSKKTNQWIYGVLIQNYIIPNNKNPKDFDNWIEVIPESIGEFIGNYNGEDLYIGDIKERQYIQYDSQSKNEGLLISKRYVLEYSNKNNNYVLKEKATGMKFDIKINPSMLEMNTIGNIYDNLDYWNADVIKKVTINS